MHKNNPRTHSPQQNKKAVLTTAAYFEVSTPVLTALRLSSFTKKGISSQKRKKLTLLLNSAYSN